MSVLIKQRQYETFYTKKTGPESTLSQQQTLASLFRKKNVLAPQNWEDT